MGKITQDGARTKLHENRRLTVPELERYIRRGCDCSVCEFARVEIAVLRQEVSKTAGSQVESAMGLWQAIQRIKSVLTSRRGVWGSRWGTTNTRGGTADVTARRATAPVGRIHTALNIVQQEPEKN